MANPDIPIELPEKPADVKWVERKDVKMELNSKLTQKPSLLIFYTKENRLLISSSRKRGIVHEEEHFSGKMMEYDYKSQKLVKGMSMEHFFNAVKSKCKKCSYFHVTVTKNRHRFMACTECWIKYMSNEPPTERIRWIKINCEGYKLNLYKNIWRHNGNNKNLSKTGLDLQIDCYAHSEPTLHACPKCYVFAKGTINNYCRFPCRCNNASIVVSCCDKWHPPIPCRLLKRWTTLRDLIQCNKTKHPEKTADTIVTWTGEQDRRNRPEIFKKMNNEWDYTDEFKRFYRRYNEMHDDSVADEEKASKLVESNVAIWSKTILRVNDEFLKQGIFTLTESCHFLMYIYIYQFYLKDSAACGVPDRDLNDFKGHVSLLSGLLQKDLAAERTRGYDLTKWSDEILNATEKLREDRKKLLAKIMENNNFDFKV